jgi:hypothetical protein
MGQLSMFEIERSWEYEDAERSMKYSCIMRKRSE